MKLAIKGGGSLIDKGIKAFIALSITITLPKEYSKENPHSQLIFLWSHITILERKSAKNYSNENPRKNNRKKIYKRIFERKSTKEYSKENP